MKNVLMIGCGKSQLKLIEAAKTMGMEVCGVDRDIECALNVDNFINVSTHSKEAVLDEILGTGKSNFCGVLCSASGPAGVTAAYIAEKFELPSFSMKLAECATSKYLLYEFCINNDIGTIPTSILDENNGSLSGVVGEVVIKPSMPIIGKKNVFYSRSVTNLDEYIRMARSESIDSKVIVQEYISGRDLGLTVAAVDGCIIWHEFYQEKNYFDKMSTLMHDTVNKKNANDDKFCAKALKVVERILNLQRSYGYVSFSFRVDYNEIDLYLYEINLGLPGDGIVDNIFENMPFGFDPYTLDVLIMTNAYQDTNKLFNYI